MMMVPYMFNDGLMDDLFSDAWRMTLTVQCALPNPAVCLANVPPM